jgi:ATP-dependent helicase HrpA
MEEKLRRPGGLWSEEAVLRFCEEHIPDHIHTAAAFHQWLAARAEPLTLTLADVLDEDPETLGLDLFPDTLTHAGGGYPLYYRTAPGERDDGVTIGVHIDQLPQLPDWLPDWGVDGQLRERVEILLRSLPKDHRRNCQPIARVAGGFAELWCRAPKEAPLLLALSEHVAQSTGAVVPVDAFDRSRLPPHLVTKIWVCDDDGNELAMGTDVAELKLRLSAALRERFEAAANEDIERRGISSWDGEALPARVETAAGPAFPALVDEGETVGIRAFASEAEAAELHRAGGARLLCLAHPAQADHLRGRFPLGNHMGEFMLRHLGAGGTSLDDLILLAAEGAAAGVFPKSPDAFHAAAATARGHRRAAHVVVPPALRLARGIQRVVRLSAAPARDPLAPRTGRLAADCEGSG